MPPLYSNSTHGEQTPTEPNSFKTQFLIRAATPADVHDIAEIIADSFHDRDGIFGWAYPLLRLGIYEDIRNRLRSTSPHHICFVAGSRVVNSDDSTHLVGTVEMGLRSTEIWNTRPRSLYISNLAVRSTYRRRGVARHLLLSCERAALGWGFQDIYLHVLEDNLQARQLYLNLGYRLHQVDANGLAWLLGRPRQLFLHKRLSEAQT